MLQAGNVFIDINAARPECFHVAPGPYPNSWAAVTREPNPRDLDNSLGAIGWTFFYRAGSIRASGFGSNTASRTAAALKRLFAVAAREKNNCLEIDSVTSRSFLGLPYVTVSAHSRHIRKGGVSTGS